MYWFEVGRSWLTSISVPVTNGGCPIQADFGLSGIHRTETRSFLYYNGPSTPCTVSGRDPWIPLSQNRLEWGTRHLLAGQASAKYGVV
jgi:hypothetical protein